MKRTIGFSAIFIVIILMGYISVSFFRIEHAYSVDNTLLLTKQTQLQHNLNEYGEAFESVATQILSCNVREKGHIYVLKEMEPSNDLLILMHECNVSWVQINSELSEITFYQTSYIKNNEVALSYIGILGSNGEITWGITKQFPDFSRRETIGVKLYNLIFNREVV